MKLYLTSSYSRFSFENPFEFIRTKAGKLLLTALSHLLYLSTFFLSPSLFLYSSSSFCLSSSSHFHSLHGFSLLPVLQEKKAVPQTRSLFNVFSSVLSFNLSFVFVHIILSLFFPAFFLSLPPTDIMLLYPFSLLCLCYMFSLWYLDNFTTTVFKFFTCRI